MAQPLFKLFGSIQKIEDNEDGTITVYGIASSGARDHADEIVAPEAMKAALPDYSKFPALREMHQPLAAGRVVEADVDEDGITNISALVVDPLAITKVKTGVYSGFSIGGKVLKRDPEDKSIITGLKLIEISLVDSPCNPDAILSMWKAETMSEFKPDPEDVIARAKRLAKAAGTQRFKEFLFEASQELVSEHLIKNGEIEPPAAVAEEPAIAAEPKEAAAEPGADAPATDAAAEAAPNDNPDEDDHSGEGNVENDETIEAAAPASALAVALEAAIAKGSDVVGAATAPSDQQAGPYADLGKVATALKSIKGFDASKAGGVPAIKDQVIAKGLYSVSRFADLLQSFAYLQECAQSEAAYEGDNSPVPAQLADAIRNLGTIFVAMAQEEVAELLAGMQGETDVEIIFIGDEIDLANTIVDAVKADADLMTKAAERIAAPVNTDEETEKAARLAELEGENSGLKKALADATPAVEDLTKRFGETVDGLKAEIADLTTKFDALDKTVIPPRTAGPGVARAVQKGDDSAGAEPDDQFAGMTPEQFDKAWAALPEEERGRILVKASLARPVAVARR
jgi:HK97 family phage prohead protease